MSLLVKGKGDVVAFWPSKGERMVEVVRSSENPTFYAWVNPRCTRRTQESKDAIREADGMVMSLNNKPVGTLHLK